MDMETGQNRGPMLGSHAESSSDDSSAQYLGLAMISELHTCKWITSVSEFGGTWC